MRKRIISVFLSVLLLLGMMPLMTEPARMAATDVVVYADKLTARVGDTLIFSANIAPAGRRYQARLIVKVGADTVFSGGFTSSTVFSYTTQYPGTHVAEIFVIDLDDNATMSGFSLPVKVALRPGPSILSITSANGVSSLLTWTAVPGVTGYRVLRANAPAGPYTHRRTTTALSASDTYLTPGVRYYYKVEGYNLVDGKVVVTTLPSAAKEFVPVGVPVITTIANNSAGRVFLAWKAGAGATGYEVYRSRTLNGVYQRLRITTALSFTDIGLVRGASYFYKILPYRRVYTTNYYGSFSAVRSIRVLR